MTRLWLASASPRRREILSALSVPFDVHVTDVDESEAPGESPVDYVARIAAKKRDAARAVLEGAVLAADTTVTIDGVVLGKPQGDVEARAMLERLSGRSHFVHTAISLAHAEQVHAEVVSTEVVFARLDARTIERYVATGEGRDKAGGYAIQGIGGGLVARITGSYSNVVGLPAHETVAALSKLGVLKDWP